MTLETGPILYCDTCPILLNAVENSFLSMDEIHNRIRRRNLPFCQDLYTMLGMTRLDGMQNFADLVLEGKMEFEEYNSPIIKMTFNDVHNNRYTFKENFRDWLDDKIPARDVVLKPAAIIEMTNIVENLPTVRVASQWSYDKLSGEFYTMWTTFKLHYYATYPYIHEISTATTEQTPVWTEKSGVYLVDDHDYFIDQISFNVLQRIAEYGDMVPLTGFEGSMQFDKTIERLRNRIEQNRMKTEDMYYKWRNR